MRHKLHFTIALLAPLFLTGCGTNQSVSSAHSKPTQSKSHTKPSHHHTTTPPQKTSKYGFRFGKSLGGYLGVVIENAPQARPQSGLRQASYVWEILAEGGITRYLALFSHNATKIGPVRSTRIYFDQLAHGYNVPFAHAGGNVDALNYIPYYHIQNLDQIYGAGPYFWRSSKRPVPHNLYTSTTLLMKGVAAKGYHLAQIPSFPKSKTLAGGHKIKKVTLTYANNPPVYVYQPGWSFQGQTWIRSINGQTEKSLSNQNITASNVLIFGVPIAPDPDPHTPGSIKMIWQGKSGSGYLLRNGREYRITWHMNQNYQLSVTRHGSRVPLTKGNHTWFEVVPTLSDVHFTP